MDYSSINFNIVNLSTAPFCVTVLLNGHVFNRYTPVEETIPVSIPITDLDGTHELRIVFEGKTHEHTVLNEQGAIVSDAVLSIADFTIDGVELGHTLTEQAVYWHNNNQDSGEYQPHKFYRDLGCNGEVVLKFTSPVYLWLLENM